MLATLVTAALAIVGALLGSIVSGLFQERAAERAVRVNHDAAIRRDQLEAVTVLACAVSDHRRAIWKRGDAVLKRAGDERIEALREEGHETRGMVARPLVTMRLLIEDQAVRATADRMIALTYAMHGAWSSRDGLTRAREAAVAAHDDFVDAAARYLRGGP
ncbi:hypothetical protein [Streptomyces sp. NPDC003077]|uniref:hypothetical protein n=1 Tax=Streptomyces sp. NPDC003077 TaxID=3154443 RepID=UPI0033B28DB3